eukprot:5260804-Pyramimonas_sp.AAC.1
MDYSSQSTRRVCRSASAAEASHLADPLEAGEWLCVLTRGGDQQQARPQELAGYCGAEFTIVSHGCQIRV